MSRGQKYLKYLFNPKSIAVIGASRNPEKAGGAVLENLIKGGYKGKIYPVNPNAEEAQGVKSYKNIEAIIKSETTYSGKKPQIDLAVIIVPAKAAGEVLAQCGEAGVKSVIIISSGFSEAGKEGRKLEGEIVAIAQKFEIALLGPNCLGVINTENNLNASFASSFSKKGNIALISQSGAIISSLIDWGNQNNLGFSKIVSLGNKAAADEIDMLDYLEKDKSTRLIAMYLETISRGKEFIEKTRKISAKKPIVVLKTGISAAGQSASQSHTGALATEDRVIDAVLRKSGSIRVKNISELLKVSQILSLNKKISREVFVVSNAGGLAVSSADIISQSKNLQLAEISKNNFSKIKKNIPEFLSIQNPLDIGGDARSDRYKNVLEIVCRRDARFPAFSEGGIKGGCATPAILTIITPQKMTDFKNIANEVSTLNKKGNLILPILAGGDKIKEAREILLKEVVPFYNFPEEAINVLDNAAGRESNLDQNYRLGIPEQSFKKIKNILEKYSAEWISLEDAFKIAENMDFPIIKFLAAAEASDLKNISDKLKFPIVAKTSVGNIVHKAKSGQVICNILNQQELKAAFKKITKPVIFQHQEEKDLELIIGAKRDKNFGAMIVFGLGGILANEIDSAKFYIAPLSREEAEDAVNNSIARKMIPAPVKKDLASLLLNLQKLILNFPQILEIDLNPVMIKISDEKIMCPDVKIKIT